MKQATVPLRLSPDEQAQLDRELRARDYLVSLLQSGRTSPRRMGRPLQWVTFAPRLASEIADLPPMFNRRGERA